MAAKFICVLALAGVAFAHVPAKREASASASASGGAWVDVSAKVSAALTSSDHSSCLDLLGIDNVKEKLEQIDYKNITVVKEIPDLTSIDKLPLLVDLKESISHARSRLVAVLSESANVAVDASLSIEEQVKVAIHEATIKAIEGPNPVTLLTDIVSEVLNTYFSLATACPLQIASGNVMAEGLQLASSCVTVVIQSSVTVKA